MMKKYNRAEIFKRMWVLIRVNNFSRSDALAKAWAEAKFIAEQENKKEEIMNSLPALKGYAKQIAWATEIRERLINFIFDKAYNAYKFLGLDDAQIDMIQNCKIKACDVVCEKLVSFLKNETRAWIIIEKRDNLLIKSENLIDKYTKEFKTVA